MKKVNKCLHILLFAVILFFCFSAVGFATDETENDGKKTSVELAKGEIADILSDFSLILPDGMEHLADGAGEMIGFEAVFGDLLSAVKGEMPNFISFTLLLVGVEQF